MHRSWRERRIQPPGWLVASRDTRLAGRALIERLYAAAWPAFVARSGNLLAPDMRSLGEALLTRLGLVWDRLDDLPVTLSHGAYRVANMAFAGTPDARSYVVFDLEDVGLGSGTIDFSWFVIGCLDSVERRAWETELIDRYRVVAATDVRADAYRLAALDWFVQGVLMATPLYHGRDRDRELAATVTRRFVSACTDLRLPSCSSGSTWNAAPLTLGTNYISIKTNVHSNYWRHLRCESLLTAIS